MEILIQEELEKKEDKINEVNQMGIIQNFKKSHTQRVKEHQALKAYERQEMAKAQREMIVIKAQQRKAQAKARVDAKIQAIRDAPQRKAQASQKRKAFVRGMYSKAGEMAKSVGKSASKAGASASRGNVGGFDKMTNMLGGSPGKGSGGFGNHDIMSGLGGSSRKGKRKGGNTNSNGWY